MRPTQATSGFTLIEALLAAAILLMAVTAITMPYATAANTEQVEIRQTMAIGLAQELMEEMLSKPFADPDGSSSPGPEAGEADRGQFDNMDDYDDLEEPPRQVADMEGNPVTDQVAQQLSRRATASYVYVDGQDTGLPPTFILLQVEVRYRQAPLASLSRLAYAYGT